MILNIPNDYTDLVAAAPGNIKEILATEMDANFEAIQTVINGNVENDNVAAAAAIDHTKINFTGWTHPSALASAHVWTVGGAPCSTGARIGEAPYSKIAQTLIVNSATVGFVGALVGTEADLDTLASTTDLFAQLGGPTGMDAVGVSLRATAVNAYLKVENSSGDTILEIGEAGTDSQDSCSVSCRFPAVAAVYPTYNHKLYITATLAAGGAWSIYLDGYIVGQDYVVPENTTLKKVFLRKLNTVVAGSDLLVDLYRNGASLVSGASFPKIPVGALDNTAAGNEGTFVSTALVAGDVLRIICKQASLSPIVTVSVLMGA